MDDREILSAYEQFAEENFGLRIRHAFDRRAWRRYFSRLSFKTPTALDEEGGRPAATWEPLTLFRDRAVQHEVESVLRSSSAERLNLNLATLLVPVLSSAAAQQVSQPMLDSIFHAFLNDRYLAKSFTLPTIHQEFAALFLYSLLSDHMMIVETDFSHERNMALKYIVRPFDNNILRTLSVSKRSNLFFSKPIASAAREGMYFGVQPTLGSIFNRDIGSSDFEHFDDAEHPDSRTVMGPEPRAGFLVAATKVHDYSCAYIIPLYTLINRHSSVGLELQRLFHSFTRILFREAQHRIDRNKHHSRLRHTIGVEVDSLSAAYREIFAERTSILNSFPGNQGALNIQMSKVNNHLEELSKDVHAQFATEFDILGDRRERRSIYQHSFSTLSADELKDLIKEVVSSSIESTGNTNITFSMEHTNEISVGSENSLRNCLQELVNNAIKYNVTNALVRIRTRNSGEEVLLTIHNFGPAVTKEEADQIPIMGLRGLNAQRHVSEGSGQGMASVFGVLTTIGVYPKYRPRPLTPEQADRLRSEIGSKKLQSLDLASHTIELTFSFEQGLGRD